VPLIPRDSLQTVGGRKRRLTQVDLEMIIDMQAMMVVVIDAEENTLE